MPRRLPRFTWLRAFQSAARHLSFTAAAAELALTPSAVSQQVRQLEDHLGVTLFQRLPRMLRFTSAGEAYLPVVTDAFERLDRGTAELFGHDAHGPLDLRAPPGFAALWLVPRLGGFLESYPGLDIRLTTTRAQTDLRRDRIDAEARYGAGDWPGLQVDLLVDESLFPVCSPWILDSRRPLREPSDLIHTRLLHVVGYREGWPQWLAAAGVQHPEPMAGGHFDTEIAAVQAALSGLGVAVGRSTFVSHHLRAGRLVAPFELALPASDSYYLVSAADRARRPIVAAFRQWLLAAAAQEFPGAPRIRRAESSPDA